MSDYYTEPEKGCTDEENEISDVAKFDNPCCKKYKCTMIQSKGAEYYMSLLNVRTAKIIALILVLLFGGVFHGVLHILYGVTPCKGLLKDGIYKAGSTAFSFRGDFDQGTGLWQPWGCMMHKYTNV